LITCYHVMLFTEFVPDAETRFNFGWSLIFCIVFATCIHIFLMVKEIVRSQKLAWRKRKAKAQSAKKK